MRGELRPAQREARLIELPAGEKELRLTLAAGTSVMALAPANREADDDAEALVWAPVDAATETLITGSSRLLLFGGESTPGEVSLELLPRSAAASAATGAQLLTGQQRLEQRFSSTGAFRVPVAAAEAGGARRLHLRGASSALFVGGDGRLQRGADFELSSAGGSLRFEHPPGLVSAWIDDGGGTLAADSGLDPNRPATDLALPTTIDLAGSSVAYDVELDVPSLLKLRSPGALAIAVNNIGDKGFMGDLSALRGRFEVYPEGARFDAVLPAGRSRLVLRALAGEGMTGTLSAVAEALLPLGEGLGEETLLAPGDSRGYSFRVARPGTVGVGVRADQGGVETLLFDAAGRMLGRGVVQWHDFDAGDYVLVVAAPAEGRPARIRPALVGASPPGSGPPPEEARRFLALAAGATPAVAGVAGAENLPADWLGVRQAKAESDGESSDEGNDESYDDDGTDDGQWNEESESSDDSGDGSEGE